MRRIPKVIFGLTAIITLSLSVSLSVACGQKKENVQRVDEPIKTDKVLWEEVISNEGNFKIEFPGKSEKVVGSNQNTQSGNYYEYRLKTEVIGYSISFGDFNLPRNLIDNELNNFYDVFQKKIAESDERKIISNKNFQLGNFSGREVIYTKNNLVLIDRYILINKRLYQILTTTSKEFSKDININEKRKKFLGSFQLLDK